MQDKLWIIKKGPGPVVAAAIHNGHNVRQEVSELMVISEQDRFREEDPFTGELTEITDTGIEVFTSRFEFDLNRNREKAIYMLPEDAWGLELWKGPLSPSLVKRSMDLYDRFYRETYDFLKGIEHRYGGFIVLDLHSYCHRRGGRDSEPADPEGNPEINIGTGSMDKGKWAKVVDRFMSDLGAENSRGRKLDVRENVRFRGGWFSKWIHKKFPETGCCIAIEIKKIFMDEWTGLLDKDVFEDIKKALHSTVNGLNEELNSIVR